MLMSCFSAKGSTGAVPKIKDEVVVYSIERQVIGHSCYNILVNNAEFNTVNSP